MKMLLKVLIYSLCLCSMASSMYSPTQVQKLLKGFSLENTTFVKRLTGMVQDNFPFLDTEKQTIIKSLFENASFVKDLIGMFQNKSSLLDTEKQTMIKSALFNTSMVEDMMELFQQYSPNLDAEKQNLLESVLRNTLFMADLTDLLGNNSSYFDTAKQSWQESLLDNSTFVEDLIGLFQRYLSFLEKENSVQKLLFQGMPVLEDLMNMFQHNSSFDFPDTDIQNVLDSILGGTMESLASSMLTAKDSDNITGMIVAMYAAQALLQTQRISEKCRNDIGLIFTNIIQQTQWALRMVDAMGKPESGSLEGNLKWLGNYEECLNIRAVTDGVEHFKGKYCRINVLGTPGTLGTCTSDSCSASDIVGILMTVQNLLMGEQTLFHTEVTCSDPKTLPTDFIVCTGLLCMLLAFVIFGTLYDALAIQMKTNKDTKDVQMKDNLKPEQTGNLSLFRPTQTHSGLPKAYINETYAETEAEKGTIDDETEKTDIETPADADGVIVTLPPTDTGMTSRPMPPAKQRSTAAKILLAFSFYTNGVKILDTNQAAGSLGAINGIRFLSMAWVILGHTYSFCIGYDENLFIHFYKSMQNWTFMAITNATVAVDSFFALSGLLVAYLTLKELKHVGGARKLNWFMFYFHRFWRLTPVYMLVLMVGTVILPYILNGPMWTDSEIPYMSTCRKYWWTNLLYVNNYVKADEPCMGWSWYLSNDMQFYIISPLMVLPLFYNQIVGAVSCMIFLIATTVTAGIVAYNHRYPVQTMSPYAPQPNDPDFMQNLYFPSYARLGPYIVGLFTGYILYRTKCKCRIPKIVNLACWFLAFTICCLCVYTPYTNEDSHIFTAKESAAYYALHRTGWGLAVCWIAFACATGHGGWIDQLLSWKAFVPLARLTYSAYLIHPLVMLVFYMSRNSTTFFSIYEVIYLFLGNLALSYGIGFIVSLMFESPMMGLEKALIKRGRK